MTSSTHLFTTETNEQIINIQLNDEMIELFFLMLLKKAKNDSKHHGLFDLIQQDYLHYLEKLAENEKLTSTEKNLLINRLNALKNINGFQRSLLNALINHIKDETYPALNKEEQLEKLIQRLKSHQSQHQSHSHSSFFLTLRAGKTTTYNMINTLSTTKEQIQQLEKEKVNKTSLEQMKFQSILLYIAEGNRLIKKKLFSNALDLFNETEKTAKELKQNNPTLRFPYEIQKAMFCMENKTNKCKREIAQHIYENIKEDFENKKHTKDHINQLQYEISRLNEIELKSFKELLKLAQLQILLGHVLSFYKKITKALETYQSAVKNAYDAMHLFNQEDNSQEAQETIEVAVQSVRFLINLYCTSAFDCLNNNHHNTTFEEGIYHAKQALHFAREFLKPALMRAHSEYDVNREKELISQILVPLYQKEINRLLKKVNESDKPYHEKSINLAIAKSYFSELGQYIDSTQRNAIQQYIQKVETEFLDQQPSHENSNPSKKPRRNRSYGFIGENPPQEEQKEDEIVKKKPYPQP